MHQVEGCLNLIKKDSNRLKEGNKSGSFWQIRERWLNRLFQLPGSKNPASRSYRYLARQIESDLEKCRTSRKIIFTSPDSLEYCNETLLMFAYFLQNELSCKVLIVDATFRRDGVSAYLQQNGAAGFSDVLYDEQYELDSLVQATQKEKIFLLPAGQPAYNGTTPVKLGKVKQLLNDVNGKFDYVLIQQGSILDDTRYLLMAPLADLILLLVEEGYTLIDKLHACQNTFHAYQIPNVRLVMATPN